jgi:membrane protein insertase Oxa1/YidC/SpoIIIJ
MQQVQGEMMTQNQTKPRSQTKLKLIIDIGIFIGFLITMEPHASGLTIHEWLATALIAVLIVHLLLIVQLLLIVVEQTSYARTRCL